MSKQGMLKQIYVLPLFSIIYFEYLNLFVAQKVKIHRGNGILILLRIHYLFFKIFKYLMFWIIFRQINQPVQSQNK